MLTLVDGDHDPDEECLEGQISALQEVLVELGVHQGHFRPHILVEHEGEHRQHSEQGRVAGNFKIDLQKVKK